jgi:large subunit ribosomal protein L25
MAEAIAIAAETRQHAGKGFARALRRAGRTPGIIYGSEIEPVLISVDPMEIGQHMRRTGFFARVFQIAVGGDTHRVLAREVQFDPVTDRLLHVDFLRFAADARLAVDVEVIFKNDEESPGIKRGGVLNVVRHTVELLCAADDIPPFLTVDLTGLDIGDSVHISDIDIPSGAEPTITDRDFTVATIAAPSLLMTVEEEEAEAAEAAEAAEGEELEEGAEGEEGEAVEEGAAEAEGEAKPKPKPEAEE